MILTIFFGKILWICKVSKCLFLHINEILSASLWATTCGFVRISTHNFFNISLYHRSRFYVNIFEKTIHNKLPSGGSLEACAIWIGHLFAFFLKITFRSIYCDLLQGQLKNYQMSVTRTQTLKIWFNRIRTRVKHLSNKVRFIRERFIRFR